MTTSSDESSTLTTSFADETSISTDTTPPESTTTEYVTFSTAIDSTTMLDSTTTSETDEPSTTLFETTTEITTELTTTGITTELTNTEITTELTTTDSPTPELTSTLLTTNEVSTEYTSTEITSTVFPDLHTSTVEYSTRVVTSPTPPPLPQPSPRRRTTASTTKTTTTESPRRSKTTRPKSSPTTTTTTTTIATPEMTTSSPELSTTPFYIWYPSFDALQSHQQMIVLKPTLSPNSSNTLLSSELLQSLFNSSNNSSNEKLIYFNLADLPPSSWNVSLHTNESVLLGIILPPPARPLTLDSTTNLSITNVEANRFATSIVGIPVNLQVDQIQTKQFSLAMNLTNDQPEQSVSDVVIGHIKSEQFELNITKSDNLNLHVQQVDSETAELFFDSKFCTNESNLQINLNLSKNGK